jgi:hypothetical protein
VADKLNFFHLGIIKQSKSKPTLRMNAACVKALVPFAEIIAMQLLDPDNTRERSMQLAAEHLNQCYEALRKATVFHHEKLSFHCQRFCLQYTALHATETTARIWKVSPKLHLFQEMCCFSSSRPALTWTYRDEDFGGIMANFSRRRGGLQSSLGVSRTTLQRFCGNASMVRIE